MSASDCWPIVKLGDVADLCLGKMLDAKKNKGRLLPYLRNPNVRWFNVDTADLQLMPFEEHEDDRYGLRAGDVVVCEGGEAGRAAVWDGRIPELKFQKAIHRVRPTSELDSRYLVHRLMADYHSGRLAEYYTGATIKHLTGQDLACYRFPLPPLSEQQRIADILDRTDALRTSRRAALAQIDALTQSIFSDMFGNAATNTREWPVCAVSDYVSGFQGGRSIEATAGNGVVTHNRVLKVSAVTGMRFLAEESKPIPDPYSAPKEHFVRSGDLLISRANTTDLVGAVAFVDATPGNLLLPDKLWRFV